MAGEFRSAMAAPDVSRARSCGQVPKSVLPITPRKQHNVKQAILIHYHEISLKKNNRPWFEGRLHQHVTALLGDLPHDGVRPFAGRMVVSLNGESPSEEIVRRLRLAFGIANFAVASEVPADFDQIRSALVELLRPQQFGSFRIDARRGTKDFPLNSQQINEQLGAWVQDLTGAAVKLENPDLTCFVELVLGKAFIYFEKIGGGGGLPSRTGGKAVCLISGGIDSPVAAFRMMRRGCSLIFVHFHSFPHTTVDSQQKVRNILRILSRYQLKSRLFLVPFAEVQREIVAYAPPPLRVILYRRFMIRIAEALAMKEKASALITGDCLGQVASQTMENLRTISAVATLPIFRPLIGDDKEEIMKRARELGTYDISIMPDEDCCSLFVPRHPETMSRLEQVEQAENLLDIERLVTTALDSTGCETVVADFLRVPIDQRR
jgi:tRNA uracil 4-sulfurtransferase